jgi:hypothetical protein
MELGRAFCSFLLPTKTKGDQQAKGEKQQQNYRGGVLLTKLIQHARKDRNELVRDIYRAK